MSLNAIILAYIHFMVCAGHLVHHVDILSLAGSSLVPTGLYQELAPNPDQIYIELS
jgi:hypothetical protein